MVSITQFNFIIEAEPSLSKAEKFERKYWLLQHRFSGCKRSPPPQPISDFAALYMSRGGCSENFFEMIEDLC